METLASDKRCSAALVQSWFDADPELEAVYLQSRWVSGSRIFLFIRVTPGDGGQALADFIYPTDIAQIRPSDVAALQSGALMPPGWLFDRCTRVERPVSPVSEDPS